MYNIYSPESIISFAKKLKNKTLRDVCGEDIEEHLYGGKGNFVQLLERFYFGYQPNSLSEPDFIEAGMELKTSPLKTLKNGRLVSKERLVLNIINYMEVYKETFDTSSFWKKNSHLLLIFYLHEKDKDVLDYLIKLVDEWKYPEEDLKIIKHDWELIRQKIEDGKAHEISEGDTFYLGACTKGSTALKSLREQPKSNKKAKQRAFSLKQGYVNHIIANIASHKKGDYGRIIKRPKILDDVPSIEDFVVSKFKPFYGKSVEQIEQELGLELNSKSKSYFAQITNAMLGLELGQRIEEFEKADIQVKTVRLNENNMPKEDISFPNFKYEELIETDWEDSDFKNILESKFFFVFYQFDNQVLYLKRVRFWNMSQSDIGEAKKVWNTMKDLVAMGMIIKNVDKNGKRFTHFPKKRDNRISHVRPHARNAADTYRLPVADKLTGVTEYTKHCFWLNARYVRDEIYLK